MRASISVCTIVLLLSTACQRSSDASPAVPGAIRDEEPPLERAPALPPPSHLLLARTDFESSNEAFVGVGLGEFPTVGEPYSMPAIPIKDWPGRYHSVASLTGSTAVHATNDGGTWRLRRRSLVTNEEQGAIALKVDEVTALMAAGKAIFVGAGNRVGVVAADAPQPSLRLLAERPTLGRKAFDLFARDGDLIVAIDDVVTPIWAELLSLDGGGTHLVPWEMPSFINGNYVAALLVISDRRARTGSLFAIGRYSIMDGHGHDLTRLDIRDGKLMTSGDVVLNATRLTDPPVLEEHFSRSKEEPTKLVAGTEMTSWMGMAVLPGGGKVERIYVAAGDRGLLSIPADFSPDTKAEVVAAVDGACHDVVAVETRLFVLTERSETGALVRLRQRGAELVADSKTPLPRVFHRFVR